MCSTDDAWPAAALGQGAPGSSGSETEFLVPVGLDLASPTQQREAAAAVAAGIAALPALAEIYPLGGAGDRLGLQCEQTGESLPTAVLQYCGRSLLENLLRDLQVGQGGSCRVRSGLVGQCGFAREGGCWSLMRGKKAVQSASPAGSADFTHTLAHACLAECLPAAAAPPPTHRHASTCTGSCTARSTPRRWPS